VVKAGKPKVGGKTWGNRKTKPGGGIEYAIKHPVIGTGIASVLNLSHPEIPSGSMVSFTLIHPAGANLNLLLLPCYPRFFNQKDWRK
jgi:hypothetical protein